MKDSGVYPDESFCFESFCFEVDIDDEWEGYVWSPVISHYLNIKIISISFMEQLLDRPDLNNISYLVKLSIDFNMDGFEGEYPATLEHRTNGLCKYVFCCDAYDKMTRDRFGVPDIDCHIIDYWSKSLDYISNIIAYKINRFVVTGRKYRDDGGIK